MPSEEFSLKGYTRFLSLFEMNGKLDLGMLYEVSPELRQVISSVVDRCVSDEQHQYTGPDGTLFEVENWQEQKLVPLRSEDGTLTLPRFVIRQKSFGKRWERAEDIEVKVDALILSLKAFPQIDEFTTGAEDLIVARKIQQLQFFLQEYLHDTKLGGIIARLDHLK